MSDLTKILIVSAATTLVTYGLNKWFESMNNTNKEISK